MTLPSWLRWLIDIGVRPETSALDARHIRATNIIALFVGFSRMGPISSAISHGELTPFLINFTLFCVQPVILTLNARGYYLAAGLSLSICGQVLLLMASVVMGVTSPILLFYMALVILPYLVIPRRDRKYATFLAIYSATAGAFFSTFQGSFLPKSVAMNTTTTIAINSLVAVVLMLLSCLSFMRMIEENESSLEREKRAQEQLNHELEQEKELQIQLNEELRQANAHKSKFLAGMSHELRTPLNAIIGFTRIVRRKGKKDLPEKQQENLDKVLSSAQHLLNLINGILDIAKIEAGQVELEYDAFSLSALVEQAAKETESLFQEGVGLEVDVAPDLPQLRADPGRVRQILLNLLSNAAKFTHEGEVRVTVGRWHGGLEVSVQDTGIGISKEAMGRIFEEFQQATSGSTRKYGGTGLGLSISLHLAQMMGGSLQASSEEGKGSIFTLRLPLDAESSVQADEPPAAM